MKTYVVKLNGVCLGAHVIVKAGDRKSAETLAIAAMGDKTTGRIYDVKEIKLKQDEAVVLWDGDY